MKCISPVPKRKEFQALRHLVCRIDEDSGFDARAESLRELFRATPRRRKWLWWNRNPEGEIQGVVMVLVSKGSVPFLYHSPADGQRVDFESLVNLIREVSRDVLSKGYPMIQRFVPEKSHPDAAALLGAGFEELVELTSMVAPLGEQRSAVDEVKGYEFVNYGNFRVRQLKTTIQSTYRGSLDCPRLVGVRPMSDIINSHKTTGIFRPQWWWMLRFKGKPVGCVLVNRTANQNEAEIIYLGVVPEFRGKGLGELMLRWTATCVHCEGVKQLTLAVDSQNSAAVNLYERFGFQKTFSRWAYAMFKEGNSK